MTVIVPPRGMAAPRVWNVSGFGSPKHATMTLWHRMSGSFLGLSQPSSLVSALACMLAKQIKQLQMISQVMYLLACTPLTDTSAKSHESHDSNTNESHTNLLC